MQGRYQQALTVRKVTFYCRQCSSWLCRVVSLLLLNCLQRTCKISENTFIKQCLRPISNASGIRFSTKQKIYDSYWKINRTKTKIHNFQYRSIPNFIITDRGVKLSTHLHPAPRLRIRGATPPLLQYVFIAWCLVKYGDDFTLQCVAHCLTRFQWHRETICMVNRKSWSQWPRSLGRV